MDEQTQLLHQMETSYKNYFEIGLACGYNSSILLAKSCTAYKDLDYALLKNHSFIQKIFQRVLELAADNEYDHTYANPNDYCLLVYLLLLEKYRPDLLETSCQKLLNVENTHWTRNFVYKTLGIKTMQSDTTIELVPLHPEFVIGRATEGSVGYDMRFLHPDSREDHKPTKTLQPGDRDLFPLGCKVAIPLGWHIKVASRSGLALKYGITVLNAPGIIDSDYRGEMQCILINTSNQPYTVTHGDRICQILVERSYSADFQIVESLSDTNRGSGGFGSTGS